MVRPSLIKVNANSTGHNMTVFASNRNADQFYKQQLKFDLLRELDTEYYFIIGSL